MSMRGNIAVAAAYVAAIAGPSAGAAKIEEKEDTFGTRARILGGAGSIAVGGLAAGILGLRRAFKRDRGLSIGASSLLHA